METKIRTRDLLSPTLRRNLGAARKIPTTPTILTAQRVLSLRHRLPSQVGTKAGMMVLAGAQAAIPDPVNNGAGRQKTSSFSPSRRGPNGAPGGHTVFRR